MSSRFSRTLAVVSLTLLFLLGLVAVSTVSAGRLSERFAPFSPDNLPSPITITGNPLRVTIGADSSIQVYHSRWGSFGQVYGWQDGSADSGIWMQVGDEIYGPDACFASRVTKNLFTVRPLDARQPDRPDRRRHSRRSVGGDDSARRGHDRRPGRPSGSPTSTARTTSACNGTSPTSPAHPRRSTSSTPPTATSPTTTTARGITMRPAARWAATSAAGRGTCCSCPKHRRPRTRRAGTSTYGWASAIAATTRRARCRDRAPRGRASIIPLTRPVWTTVSACSGSGRLVRALLLQLSDWWTFGTVPTIPGQEPPTATPTATATKRARRRRPPRQPRRPRARSPPRHTYRHCGGVR